MKDAVRRAFSSPAHVVATGVLGLGLWTCGYRTVVGEPTVLPVPGPAEVIAPPIVDRDPPSPAPATSEHELVEPEGPWLRHEPDPSVLGLPVGIENGPAMSAFHGALRRAERGEGHARIVFYGASHVASDSFTGYVRTELQRRFGDAGHGFVLPVHPWPSYQHQGVRIESNYPRWTVLRPRATATEIDHYGLAGVAVESNHRGAFGAVSTATHGEFGDRASRFEIFYLEQPSGGDFDVLVDGTAVARIATRLERVAPGYETFQVSDAAHRLEIRVRGNGDVRIFGVSVERDQAGVVLDTLGINGARARLHLLWEDQLYRAHLARRRPDLVVLAYGTNEAGDTTPIEQYESEVRQVIARVREAVPRAACLLLGPTDRPIIGPDGTPADLPRTGQINDIQRSLAFEYGCGYFDLVAFQGGPLSMVAWVQHDPPFGGSDYVHFTRPGYQRLAEELLDALLFGYSSSQPSGTGGPSATPTQ